MSTIEEHPLKAEDISTGLRVLKKRQTKVSLLSFSTAALFILSVVGLFVQQDFVYSFVGLTQTVEQLHLPYTVDQAITEYANQPDYFINLLAWFGWLIVKVFSAFFGAFIIIALLKKIRFFYVRFQSFVLKFVAWLIAVIVIWSGLTFVQYDLRSDDAENQYALVHYDQNINQSEIAQALEETDANPTVKVYVLAQTALLHKPLDKDVATSNVAQLVQAERTQKNFIEYGFKPEQLWVMQHQVYGKSVTPMAQAIESKVHKADQFSNIIQILLLAISAVFLVITLLLGLLASRLKGRTRRIEQQIQGG
ncbi:hypothetical protein G9F31_10845 [Acinetobacter sp. 187]|uniref:hypothetical protein n=1 Tax=Acinetobacter lanii TaxID=2715163 RepID=UPI001409002B|nr:hypothetical protein [Acinetobacter lanii]NHC04260.1 hypothetical protein [Acinetobacter lanii]